MKPTKHLKNLRYLMPIIYPSFFTSFISTSEELVFLNEEEDVNFHTGESKQINENFIVDNKTQWEAMCNHFHLFEKVKMADYAIALEIGTAIAQNLLNELFNIFPDKNFVVYLQLNINETTIIRFHQIWDDEPPYFDTTRPFEDGTRDIQGT